LLLLCDLGVVIALANRFSVFFHQALGFKIQLPHALFQLMTGIIGDEAALEQILNGKIGIREVDKFFPGTQVTTPSDLTLPCWVQKPEEWLSQAMTFEWLTDYQSPAEAVVSSSKTVWRRLRFMASLWTSRKARLTWRRVSGDITRTFSRRLSAR
jgi:hypothetical protein